MIKEDGAVGFEVLRSRSDHHVVRRADNLSCFDTREEAERIAEIQFLLRLIIKICDKEEMDWRETLRRLINGWVVPDIPEEIAEKLMKL